MAIKYYLQPNPVTPDPNDQSARVAPNQTLNTDDIIRKILKRGTLVTETDVKAVLTIFYDVVTDEVAEGNFVNLPLVNIRPSVTGVFTNANDTYEPKRHVKKATISSGLLLGEKIDRASVEKTTSYLPMPSVMEFMDVNTSIANSKLTPGGIGQITGSELKFNPDNKGEGIFFIDGAGIETQAIVYAMRTEGRLMFIIPTTLTPGTYVAEVRKGYGKTVNLRSGSLSDFLQVA